MSQSINSKDYSMQSLHIRLVWSTIPSLIPRPLFHFYLWWQKKGLVDLHRKFCSTDSQNVWDLMTITEAFLTKCQWWSSLVHHQIAKQKVCKESCSIWRLYCVHLLKCTHSLLQTCWHLFYVCVSHNYWWRLMNQIDSSQKRAAQSENSFVCIHWNQIRTR